ncbi:MAG: S8 family peptidase, partial [Chloroflexota bacterium]
AVIDDGVDFSHIDLAERAWTNPGEAGELATNGIDDDGNGYIDDVHGWDFCNDDDSVHDRGMDGHGTHVAGTIAASLNGQGVVGVAPGVRIMALKFIDDSGACGRDDMAVAAIDYAASFGVRIINASWGGSQPSAVLDAAIADSGALFVAAAGNWGINLDQAGGPRFYPASSTLPNVLTVGAIDQTGARASFSNLGTTSVDLAAPGTNILSTYPAIGDCSGSCYAWSAGTSMAAPHVSGVAALVGSHDPALLSDPIGLRSRLLATGQALGGTRWSATGRLVNAYHAVDAVAPVAAAPDRFSLKVGTVVGTTSVPVQVSWPAATDATSPITTYGVKRIGPGKTTTLATATAARKVATRLAFRSSYTFRLNARDAAGNVSAAAVSPAVVTRLHADTSTLARYGSGWRTVTSSAALGGRVRTTSRAGASVTITFTGRSFALVAPKGPTRGSIKVTVDGVVRPTVSLRRSTTKSRLVVFSTSWATKGRHVIRIEVVGRKRVDLDGFVIVR